MFEAIKVTDGVPFALTRHLARLARSAAGMQLPEPDLDEIRAGVLALLAASGQARARLRITLTGGISPLGSQRGDGPMTAIIALGSLPDHEPACDVVIGSLAAQRTRRAGRPEDDVLCGERAGASLCDDRGGQEAIFANVAGHLCEGTGANVFVVSGGRLLTPPLSSGCLAGVTRDLVIEWAGAVEEDLPAGALAAADEAFLTGTTRDVMPIRSVDSVPLPAAPGPVTAKAAEAFSARSAECLDP